MRIVYSDNRRELAKHLRELVWQDHLDKPFSRGFFIVPESEKANMERLYFEENNDRSLMLEEILSFQRFSLRMSEISGAKNDSRANAAIATYLLSELINELDEDLDYFKSANEKPAYLNKIKDVLGDLWRFEIVPEMLEEVSSQAKESLDLNFSNKLKDLALISDKYKEKLKNNNIVPSDARLEDLKNTLELLVEKLELVNGNYDRLDFPFNNFSFLKDSSIWIYGFGISRSFTPQETAIVEALDKLVKELVIAVEADFIPNDLEDLNRGKRQFIAGRSLIHSFSIKYPDLKIETLDSKNTYLAKYSFDQFNTPEDESRYIAGKIKWLLFENEDIKPQNIGIALASPSQALSMRIALEELNLPFYMQDTGDLDYALLDSYLKGFLNMIKYPDDLSMIINYVKNPYSGLNPEEQDDLIDFWHSRAFEGYEIWEEQKYAHVYRPGELNLNIYEDEDEDIGELLDLEEDINLDMRINRINLYRSKALNSVKELILTTRDNLTIHEYTSRVIEFLSSSTLADKVQEKIGLLIDANRRDDAEIESKSWNNLIKSLSAFLELERSEKISIDDYLYYLEEAYLANNKMRIPANANQIIVSSLKQMASENVDVLFIVNAMQKTIPQNADRLSILNSIDRFKMNQVLENELPDPEKHLINANESDLWGLMALPKKYISISYAGNLDDESNTLKRFRERMGVELVSHENLYGLVDPRLAKPERAWMRVNVKDLEVESEAIDVLKEYLEATREYILSIWSEGVVGREMEQNGSLYLDKDLVARALSEKRKWSISQLEKYRSNPFSYYVEYLLGLKSKQTYKPEASKFGTLVHKVMELAQMDWQANVDLKDGSRDENLKTLLGSIDSEIIQKYLVDSAIEDKELELFFESGSPYLSRHKAYLTSLQGSRVQIRELMDSDIEWLPFDSEWTFGFSDDRSFKINLSSNKEISLRGLIDRVDIVDIDESRSGFRVIDYKTGNKRVDFARLYYGYDLQLPIYLAAFEKLNPGFVALDASYAHLSSHFANDNKYREITTEDKINNLMKRLELSSIGMEEDDLHLLMQHSLDLVDEIIAKISSGDFSSRPRAESIYSDPTRYTEYRALAQLDRGHIRVEYEEPLRDITSNIDAEASSSVKGRSNADKDKQHLSIILQNKYSEIAEVD